MQLFPVNSLIRLAAARVWNRRHIDTNLSCA